MSRYHRENPDQPIIHDAFEGVQHVRIGPGITSDLESIDTAQDQFRPELIREATEAIIKARDIVSILSVREKDHLHRTSPVYRQLVDMIGIVALNGRVEDCGESHVLVSMLVGRGDLMSFSDSMARYQAANHGQ